MARRPSFYGNKQRTLEAKRTAAVMLLTYRRTLDGLTAEDLARTTGISVPEASSMLERERLVRGSRSHG